MCGGKPDIPDPVVFQQSQAPVYRDRADTPSTGRRSTALTGGGGVNPDDTMTSAELTTKKTALGA